MTLPLARATRPSDLEVEFTRLLAAPPQLVWDVWTDPTHVDHWYGPIGFTTTTHEFALVPGGVWRHVMHGPDGTDYPTRVVFREIDAPSRLVYDNGWDLPDAPLDFSVVMTFEPRGTQTLLTQRMVFRDHDAVRVAVERYGVLQGGVQTFERLAAFLSA